MNQTIFDMYVPLIINNNQVFHHSLILHIYHLKTYAYMTFLVLFMIVVLQPIEFANEKKSKNVKTAPTVRFFCQTSQKEASQ